MKHFPVPENANLVIKWSFTVASVDFMVLFWNCFQTCQ